MGRGAWLVVVGMAVWSGAAGAESRAVSQAERLATGILEIVSQAPGAQVRVDGDLRGRTPVRVAGLLPGMHLVEVGPVGKGFRKEVLVKQGAVVRVEASAAGSPSDAPTVTAPDPTQSVRDWLRDTPALVAMFQQPWAYLSAAACGIALVGAGILWTATPERFPVVGKLPVNVTPMQYQVARWGAVGIVGVLALGTVILFVLPTLPILRDLAPSAPSS